MKKLSIILLFSFTVPVSCSTKLEKTFRSHYVEMSSLISDSTGFYDQSGGGIDANLQKRKYYFFEIDIGSNSRDSLMPITNKIDALLLAKFSFLKEFAYRFYTINLYKTTKSGRSRIDTVIFESLKVSTNTISGYYPPATNVNYRYRKQIDSLLEK